MEVSQQDPRLAIGFQCRTKKTGICYLGPTDPVNLKAKTVVRFREAGLW